VPLRVDSQLASDVGDRSAGIDHPLGGLDLAFGRLRPTRARTARRYRMNRSFCAPLRRHVGGLRAAQHEQRVRKFTG
jgi:hypothetical protein